MGVFEFLIVAVVVSAISKTVTAVADRRALPAVDSARSEEVDALRDAVADLGTRLHRLEEERDFYKNLLEAPPGAPSLRAPETE